MPKKICIYKSGTVSLKFLHNFPSRIETQKISRETSRLIVLALYLLSVSQYLPQVNKIIIILSEVKPVRDLRDRW